MYLFHVLCFIIKLNFSYKPSFEKGLHAKAINFSIQMDGLKRFFKAYHHLDLIDLLTISICVLELADLAWSPFQILDQVKSFILVLLSTYWCNNCFVIYDCALHEKTYPVFFLRNISKPVYYWVNLVSQRWHWSGFFH